MPLDLRLAPAPVLERPEFAHLKQRVSAAVWARRDGLFAEEAAGLDVTAFHLYFKGMGVKLTPVELGRLFSAFDADSRGVVEVRGLRRSLLELGNRHSKLKKAEALEVSTELQRTRLAQEARVRETRVKLTELKIPETTTEEDRTDALAKLDKIASVWVPGRGVSLDPLTMGGPLKPTELWHMLRALFGLTLLPRELAALFDFLDVDGNGSIDGAEFASRFFLLSNEHRARKVEEERQRLAERLRREHDLAREAERKFASRTTVKIRKYTEEDEASALEKIAVVARGDLHLAAAPELRPFKEGQLDPTLLAQYLKVSMRVHLTTAELSALFGCLDASGDGLIDSAEFCNLFYKLARRGQREVRREKEHTELRRAQRETKLQTRQKDLFAKRCAAKVIWPSPKEADEYSDDDDDDAPFSSVSAGVSTFLDDIDRQWDSAKKQFPKERTIRKRRKQKLNQKSLPLGRSGSLPKISTTNDDTNPVAVGAW